MTRLRHLTAAAALLGAIVAPVVAAPAASADTSATIMGFAYHPDPINVPVGTKVTWTNLDGAPHSVTANGGAFDSSPSCTPSATSGCIQPNGTFSFTFNTPGAFAYHCHVHSFMSGTVNVAAPALTLTAVTPGTIGQGAANRKLTLTGSGFVSGATVSFSGTGLTAGATTVVSSTSLTVKASASPTAATGSRDVTVTNPDHTSATCTGCLVVDPGPHPTSASPASEPRGSSGQVVTVSGTAFQPKAKVSFKPGGVTASASTFVSSSTISAPVTVSSSAATGPRTLTVTNPDGGRGSCSCFSVT